MGNPVSRVRTVCLYRKRGSLGFATHWSKAFMTSKDYEFLGFGKLMPDTATLSGVRVPQHIHGDGVIPTTKDILVNELRAADVPSSNDQH